MEKSLEICFHSRGSEGGEVLVIIGLKQVGAYVSTRFLQAPITRLSRKDRQIFSTESRCKKLFPIQLPVHVACALAELVFSLNRSLSILLFFFSCFFFYESQALHRQINMLWHMLLLFGDAFGPAYAIFWCFCIQLCYFGGGSNFENAFKRQSRYFMVVSGVHSSVVLNACVCSRMYACMQSTLSVRIQQYDPETYLET